MIFAALACYGVAFNVARPVLLRYGPLPVLCRAQAVALVLTAPFGIAVLPESSFSWHSALAVVALGVLGHGRRVCVGGEERQPPREHTGIGLDLSHPGRRPRARRRAP